jgi:hypothetical protein
VPRGYSPTLETKERECWKLRDSRLNSEFDSRVHGQPYFHSLSSTFRNKIHSRVPFHQLLSPVPEPCEGVFDPRDELTERFQEPVMRLLAKVITEMLLVTI